MKKIIFVCTCSWVAVCGFITNEKKYKWKRIKTKLLKEFKGLWTLWVLHKTVMIVVVQMWYFGKIVKFRKLNNEVISKDICISTKRGLIMNDISSLC